jgi:activator of 2-hydroxyglutaryl-CoA dehydratase
MTDYKDEAIHRLLEMTIEKRVKVPDDPQIVGALGAALYGHGKYRNSNRLYLNQNK